MKERVPTDSTLIENAHRLANLPIGADGAASMVPVMDGVLRLLDCLHDGSLEDAPLAAVFDARWVDGR